MNRRKLLGTAAAAGVVAAGGGVLLSGGLSSGRAFAQDTVADGEATPTPLGAMIPEEFDVETNWPAENYDLAGTRDAKGSSINAETVGTLGTAWSFPVKAAAAFGALTANPTIVGDMIFVQDAAANVYALNKETGEQVWANMYNDVVPSGGPNGVAAAYGLLFTTIGGVGDVVALDQGTGEEIWRTNIKGPLNEGITTYPGVHDNVVFVSTIPGSSEGFYGGGQRGVIHALDAASGAVLWYFDTTTDNLWGNPTVNSGGGFWHPPSFDEDGKLYVGIGNPAPYPGTEEFPWGTSRPGDNLYTDSILKMDPKTATLDWYHQVKPHDLFDLDNQLTPILADVDGQKLVYTSGKHGIVVCLNRETGEVVWQTPVGTHQNDETSEEQAEGTSLEVFPGTLGGVETSMAYSVANNLLICPVYELATTWIGSGIDPEAGFNFTTATGYLVALNGSDGSIVWQVELSSGPLAGATLANDVVFTAGLDGAILGFNIADGTEVFRYQATAGINAQAAVSGDYIYFPAGGPLIPSAATSDPAPEVALQVIALKLGGEMQPAASPVAGGDANPQATPEDSGIMGSEDDGTPEAGS
ncbi:MAG: PQQ-binding-like beta-propeller repeat protein [Thermomicrobiales bacterium]|nr:PQQ-binding-like beta-propeller repeat protein [Thermomicrobiales bacterium]